MHENSSPTVLSSISRRPYLGRASVSPIFGLQNVLVRHVNETERSAVSVRVTQTCSGFKVIVEDESDRILGARLLGPQAEEVINLFALAIRLGLTGSQLKEAILAYPTNGADIEYML